MEAPRTFRLFVSSTFQDLEEERNRLHEHVFPRLKDLCRRRGCRFQAIDLRWGVSGEAALDQQTLNICLQEVERCREVTTGPSFLVLLGDRYGWRPLPPQIPAGELETLLGYLSSEDRELVCWRADQPRGRAGWYRLDENAEPPEYRLRRREIDLSGLRAPEQEAAARRAEAEAWVELESRMLRALRDAAERAGLSPDDRFKYEASATEQEIRAGALEVDDPEETVFCFFRALRGPPEDARLGALKDRLREVVPGNVHEYGGQGSGEGPAADPLGALPEDLDSCLRLLDDPRAPETLCVQVWIRLGRAILAEIERPAGAFPGERTELHVRPDAFLDAEGRAHCDFANRLLRFFLGRDEPREVVRRHLSGRDPRGLAVVGRGGAGKSALMARVVQEAQGGRPGGDIVYRFLAATPASSDGRTLLAGLCREIARRYGAEESVSYDLNELATELRGRLALATAERPLVVVLDGLDQLAETDGARSLGWLPGAADLPEHVRVVVSTRRTDIYERLAGKRFREVSLAPMSREEGGELLGRWLRDAGRQLQEDQRELVLGRFQESGGLPLYLKLAFEEARRWRSHGPEGDDRQESLEPGVEGIVRKNLFPRLALARHHGELLVSRALGYLAASRHGLAEDEILDLLSRDAELYASFLRTAHHVPPGEPRLPVVLWSRLVFDLGPYLTERRSEAASLLAFYHRELGSVAAGAYLGAGRGRELHGRMAAYFRDRADPGWDRSWEGRDVRGLSELPYHLTAAGGWRELHDVLTDFRFLERKAAEVGVQPGPGGSDPTSYTGILQLQDDLDDALDGMAGNGMAGNGMAGDGMAGDGMAGAEASAAAGVREEQVARIRCLRRTLRRESHVLVKAGGRLAPHLHNMISLDWGAMAEAAPLLAWSREVADGEPWLRLANRPPVLRDVLVGVLEHGGTVWGVAWSPRGDRLASVGSDGALRVWDVDRGLVLVHATPVAGDADSVAWSPEGTTVASGHHDGTLRLWDAETGAERHVLDIAADGVLSLAWSPDGEWLAAGIGGGPVRAVEVETGRIRHVGAHHGHVYALAWSPDGGLLASGGADARVRLWDRRAGFAPRDTLEDRELLGRLGEIFTRAEAPGDLVRYQAAVVALAWSPDGSTLASGTRTGALRLWDPVSASPGDLLLGNWGLGIWALAWSPDGEILAWGAGEGLLVLGSPRTRQQVQLPMGHTEAVRDLAYGPDGKLLASCGDDGSVRLWEARALWDRSPGLADPTRGGHSAQVYRVVFCGDHGRLAVSDANCAVALWDGETGELLGRLGRLHGPVFAMAPGDRGVLLASAGFEAKEDVPVLAWREAGREPTVVARVQGPLFALALSPDGGTLASGDVGGTVWLTGLADGSRRGVFLVERALGSRPEGLLPVWGLAWSPDGTFLAAAGRMGLIIWKVPTRTEPQTVLRRPRPDAATQRPDGTDLPDPMTVWWIEDHPVAWSPDGELLASSSAESAIRLWRPVTGDAVAVLEGHRDAVTALAWAPDARRLASVGRDATVRVWEVRTGRCLATAHCLSPALAVRFADGAAGVRVADDGSATGLRPVPYVFDLRGRVHRAP